MRFASSRIVFDWQELPMNHDDTDDTGAESYSLDESLMSVLEEIEEQFSDPAFEDLGYS
jgi:hypothetical protein